MWSVAQSLVSLDLASAKSLDTHVQSSLLTLLFSCFCDDSILKDMHTVRNYLSQSMTLTCGLVTSGMVKTCFTETGFWIHRSSISHRCIGKLLPVVCRLFVNIPMSLCSTQKHPRLWCTKAIFPMQVGCYSLRQRGVFGPGPTAEAPFYKAVNIGYEPRAYEVSICESAPSVTPDAPLGLQRLD